MAALLPASAAHALSCVNPADRARMAEIVVVGEVVGVAPVRTFTRTPWPSGKPVAVQEHAAQVRTLQTLRGPSAPATVTYLFRDKRINCDFDPAVRPGERVVLTLTRRRNPDGSLTAPDVVNAFTPERYARLTADQAAARPDF
jgi:hypothetical protein